MGAMAVAGGRVAHWSRPVVDSEEAWQRAHLPGGFAEFVHPRS